MYPYYFIPVVTLTYSRQDKLIEMLKSLEDVQHLHKVIVIWNNPVRPTSQTEWPSIGVPIEVQGFFVPFQYFVKLILPILENCSLSFGDNVT